MWVIVTLPLISGIVAYAVSSTQSPLYTATVKVLVNRSSVASAITNVQDPALGDPTRFLATEATVAQAPAVAAQVVATARIPALTASRFRASSSVSPEQNADILDVSVTWPTPVSAIRLANIYAEQFTRYKTHLDTDRIERTLRTLRARLASLKAAGAADTASYGTLVQDQAQLETIGTLLANNTQVLTRAGSATKVRPRPTHKALLGVLLGAVVGLGLAFLAEALDRRVRSEQEIEALLGVPLLGRIPTPPDRLRETNGLIMFSEPASPQAEGFRKLRTTIEFLNIERGARTIMLSSPLPREGKSTTVANLAVALARSGRRVALADLDLRQPFIHKFFGLDGAIGISDVLAGRTDLASTAQTVLFDAPTRTSKNGNGPRRSGSAQKPDSSMLTVLPAGTLAPASGDALTDLLASERLNAVVEELGEQYELVLADTPPLLAVSDAIALTAKVDAVVLVLHTGIHRRALEELARQLQTSRAPVLGYVATGVSEDQAYGYGYAYGNAYGAPDAEIRTRSEPAAPGTVAPGPAEVA